MWIKVSNIRLGFCRFKLMPQNCHSRMFLAGIQVEWATWIPDKRTRVWQKQNPQKPNLMLLIYTDLPGNLSWIISLCRYKICDRDAPFPVGWSASLSRGIQFLISSRKRWTCSFFLPFELYYIWKGSSFGLRDIVKNKFLEVLSVYRPALSCVWLALLP